MNGEAAAPMLHEPFDELAILAAVGALDDQEQLRLDAHLAAGCPRCEGRLRQFSAVAATLPLALPDVPVPGSLRGRIMADVAGESQPSARALRAGRLRRGYRARRWVGGLVAAGLLGAFGWGLHGARSAIHEQQASIEELRGELARHRLVTALVSHTDTGVTALQGTSAAGRADGWIVWSPSRRQGFLVVHYLPPLPRGQQYQLWAIAGPAQSAGVFDVDPVGHAAVLVAGDVMRPDLFAVTVETAGGAPAPTGPVVMKSGDQPG